MSNEALVFADADGNGTVNIRDATLIQKFTAGVVADFPKKEETTGNVSSAPSTEGIKTEITTQAPTQVIPSGTLPVTEPTVIPTQRPTKPSVDSDGYFDIVIRP